MAVYNTKESFQEVAEEIASERGTRLRRTLDDCGREPVVYVDPPSALREDKLLKLQKRQLRYGPKEGRFSVVTGYSADHARDLYFQDRSEGRGPHGVVSMHPVCGFEYDDVTVLDESQVTASAIDELQSEDRLQSLSILSGGWSMHLNLHDGYICGYPSDEDVSEYDAREAYCVQDGEMDCPLEEKQLRADSIDANDVFMLSCASVIDNNTAGLPVHVGMGVLTSANTMIGSYRVSPNLPCEALLHCVLVRAGYSLSERCYYLNQNAAAIDLKSHPYVPFGVPEASSPAPVRHASPDVNVEDDEVLIFPNESETNLINVVVPKDKLPDSETYYLRTESGSSPVPVFYYTAVERDGLRVVVYAGNEVNWEGTVFRVEPRPVRYEDRRAITDCLENAMDCHKIGMVKTDTGQKQLKNLFYAVRSMAKTISGEKYAVHKSDEISERIDSVLSESTVIGSEIIKSVQDRGEPMKTYGHRALGDGAYTSDQNCHACGRRLFIRGGASVSGTVRRKQGTCPRCGAVFDVPVPKDRKVTPPKIRDRAADAEDDTLSWTVTFENELDHHVYCSVAFRLFDFVNLYTEPISPVEADTSLEAGARMEIPFEIDLGSLPDNYYQTFAYITANNQLYTAMRPLLVGEKGGFRY